MEIDAEMAVELGFCPRCGTERTGDRYCGKCGYDFEAPSASEPAKADASVPSPAGAEPRPKKRKGWPKPVRYAIFGLIGLYVLGVLVSPRADTSTEPEPDGRPRPFSALKADASQIPYDDLFRNNDEHIGKEVYYTAELIQVVDGFGDDYEVRANVTEGEFGLWEDTVYLHYSGARLLEGDHIEFVGRVDGLEEYTAVLGNSVTIPELTVLAARVMDDD